VIAGFDHINRSYGEVLDAISSTQHGVWITGGTLLAASMRAPYAGDLDLIFAGSQADLKSKLVSINAAYQELPRGIIRAELPDGNHMDLCASNHFGRSENIINYLDSFHLSSVSRAQNITTGEILSTERNDLFYDDRILRFNEASSIKSSDAFATSRAIKRQINGFNVEASEECSLFVESTDKVLLSNYINDDGSASVLKKIYGIATLAIPDGVSFFLCRGVVRNAVHYGLSVWDDIDVITESPRSEVIDVLKRSGIEFTINYFGNPKIRTNLGIPVDIICTDGLSIAETAKQFVLNMDRLVWNHVDEKVLCDAVDERNIRLRKIEILRENRNSWDLRGLRYSIIKSYYHAIRDECLVPKEYIDYETTRNLSYFEESNIYRLSLEIKSTKNRENIKKLLSSFDSSQKNDILSKYSEFLIY
jgi:hypothetical protein